LKITSCPLRIAMILLSASFLCFLGGAWGENNKKASEIPKHGFKKDADPMNQSDKKGTEAVKQSSTKEAVTSKQGGKKEAEPPKPVTITANRMEVNRKLRIAIYMDNVVVKKEDLTIYAQRVEFLFDEKMEAIQKVTAEGGVRIVDPEKTATSERAIYLNDQDMLILIGNARVWQGDNVITGSKMTLLRKEERSIVESDGKGRITSVFYPNKEETSKGGVLQKAKTDQERSGTSNK
jgi:lipopolysaccharide export system protein LptA